MLTFVRLPVQLIVMIDKIPEIVRTSELRKNLSHYIKQSAKQPVVISTDRGGDSRVLLGRGLYNELVEAYEDMEDRQELEHRVEQELVRPQSQQPAFVRAENLLHGFVLWNILRPGLEQAGFQFTLLFRVLQTRQCDFLQLLTIMGI